jgi:hypothetical protein
VYAGLFKLSVKVTFFYNHSKKIATVVQMKKLDLCFLQQFSGPGDLLGLGDDLRHHALVHFYDV